MYFCLPFLPICVKGGQIYFFFAVRGVLRGMPASLFLPPSFHCSNPFARREESVPHICIYVGLMLSGSRELRTYIQYTYESVGVYVSSARHAQHIHLTREERRAPPP